MIKLQLHENWQLCNIRQLDWIPAQIPGDIYAALLKTGKMPDPFFGDNEYQAKALMEEDYEYRTVFNYEEAQFKDCQEVILRFDGIDTIADIYLNGCCLGKVDNMHRIWEFPVGELLENGKNTSWQRHLRNIKTGEMKTQLRDLCICAKLTICVAGTGVHVCRMEVSSVL